VVFNWKQRRLTRRRAGWILGMLASELATMPLWRFNVVENKELIWIVWPSILGIWWCVAGGWGIVEVYLERRRGGGRGNSEEEGKILVD